MDALGGKLDFLLENLNLTLPHTSDIV